ncbi:MAG: exopolysaccharide biosynthesis protein, partial [Chthoniobacterales bacterium]
ILIAVLALQMLAGRTTPWLPERAARTKLNGKFIDAMLGFFSKFFGKVEFLIRPRFRWVGSRAGLAFLGTLVLIMAGLMILPIPLTNTFPAFVIFLTGIGLTEEDGLFSIFAGLLGVVATGLYAVVVYIFVRFGLEGIDMIKEWIKSAAGMAG